MKSKQLGFRASAWVGGASTSFIAGLAGVLVALVHEPASAQVAVAVPPTAVDVPSVPNALSSASVPSVPGIGEYIQDSAAAVALGKALFWDTAIGSDGVACASCHFHAGADNRIKNQVDPGILRQDNTLSAESFQATASGAAKSGPNYTLRASDFPFHKLSDPSDRDSRVLSTTDDVVSSQGTFSGEFIDGVVRFGFKQDFCKKSPSTIFNVAGIGTRKVEPRNTPTMINAVFNFRNFWDGRANNVFNGMNPFGLRDKTQRIHKLNDNGTTSPVTVALVNSSLASQAAGPPLSDFEMSCQGRTFADIGRKVLSKRALLGQSVALNDSVLAQYRALIIPGLSVTYSDLVKRAFKPAWWKGTSPIKGYNHMENNFSLFWGLAIQAYEATLVSDSAPYDAWARAGKPAVSKVAGFGGAERRGLDVFMGKGKCINCHGGPEFTNAGTPTFDDARRNALVSRMLMGDHEVAVYDEGFYNIGVTPTAFDIGLGGVDPIIGQPLSFSRQYEQELLGFDKPDEFEVDPCTFEVPTGEDCNVPPTPPFRTAVNGAFKVPTLRNVELTGPYMHNGSMATLEQVVEFYNRGGNFKNGDLDADIGRIGFSAQEKADLVAFLKSLTDPRVRYKSAPFDHPELRITNGHAGDQSRITLSQNNMAVDTWTTLPAVGRTGTLIFPLQPFTPAK
jgi:cytochrome c peroxidase